MANISEEGFARIMDAANRGRETQRRKRLLKYTDNPKFCKFCKTILHYKKRHNKFCSQSCSASYSNFIRGYKVDGKYSRTRIKRKCIVCNQKEVSRGVNYCSAVCQADANLFKKLKEGTAKADAIKHYYKRKFGELCFVCKLKDEWNGLPIKMQLDHIDGKASNNTLENCRLICLNCHSQTPTYGGKNKGRSTRTYRYSKKNIT